MSLTDEGRDKISQVQEQRWQAYRDAHPTCPKGHPFTEDNTLERADRKGRMCRQCGRDASREYRELHREEINARRRARDAARRAQA